MEEFEGLQGLRREPNQCSVLLESTVQKSGDKQVVFQAQAIVPGAPGGERTKRAKDQQPSLEEGKAQFGEGQKPMAATA